MIELMLKHARLQLIRLDAHLVAIEVTSDDVDLFRPHDVPRQTGNRQTTLVKFPLSVRLHNLGVDQRVRIVAHLEVVDEEALANADLWGRKSESGLGIHGLEHVLGQLHKRAIDIGDLLGHLFENRVAILADSIRGAHEIQGYRWHVVSPSDTPSHYFDDAPQTTSARRSIELALPDMFLTLETDSGVFSGAKVDAGTKYLLLEMPPIPAETSRILDLGCGYGPIALVAATRCPEAEVWAVDINSRARNLAADNAKSNDLSNVTVAAPDEVPSELRFDLILSNPPIRIGKPALHQLLERWLPTLSDSGRAVMVVQKHLGSDSLAAWLTAEGWPTTRLGSRKGYRILGTTR